MHAFPPAQPAEEHCPRGRVLLVAVDPDSALFVTFVLGRHGRFEVTHTADPSVALVLAATQPWDLVLADADLPVLSGMELLTALRKLTPDVPVAMLTTCPLDDRSAAVPGSGRPDAVLPKPVKAATLLAVVGALAAHGRQGDRRPVPPASGGSVPPSP